MNFETLKAELETIIHSYYHAGIPAVDIQAALHYAKARAIQIGELELLETARVLHLEKQGGLSHD